MIDQAFFITGAPRSGTTLLDKLLDAQPDVSVLSQPFPLLFVEAKRAFLRSVGAGDGRYPIGHLFLESRYERGTFAEFLARWRPSRTELERVFAEMEGYSGQYTRFDADRVTQAFDAVSTAGDFAAVVGGLVRALAPDEDARWFGSKETGCEEFVPALLARGARCVIIVRDPRDAIASLNHGRGPEFGGAIKPTLFNVRVWRRSVACVLAMEGEERFHWCRYEDLVADPGGQLSRLACAIGLGGERASVPGELRDATGAVWRGNSSHGAHDGVSRSSVGTYRDVLPAGVAALIEAACLPELRLLGYDTTLTGSDARGVVQEFREPYRIAIPDINGDAATPDNLSRETERLDRIAELPDADSARWFVFGRAHQRLREAFRP